jgi:hypothetical protein
MLFALVLTLISISSGTLLTYTYDEDGDLPTRVAQGGPLGLVGLGFVGLVWSALMGLGPLTVGISSLSLALIACLLAGSRAPSRFVSELRATRDWARAEVFSPSKQVICLVLAFAVMSVLLWQVFDRAMFFRDGSLYTGVANDYGDLPFHLTVITRFAYGGNIPPEDPVYSGTRFSYPYLADFVAALLVRAGASLRGAMLLESMILVLSLLWLLFKWSLELTGDRAAAMINPVLVLLGSGLGFAMIFPEARETERGLLSLIWRPIHDYTIMGSRDPEWGDSLTYLLVTQRSMLLGLPLAIIIFRQWWRFLVRTGVGTANGAEPASKSAEPVATVRFTNLSGLRVETPMLAAGVIAGFVPVCHTHTFLVVIVIGACLAIMSKDRRGWASFFVPAVILGATQAWSISHGSTAQFKNFFALSPGWESGSENHDQASWLRVLQFFWFWLKNTGAMIPLIMFAVLRRSPKPFVPRPLLFYYLPFLACLVLPNLFKLAPWTWDNMKVLFYWYLASAPLAALVLARLWRGRRWRRAVSGALLISLVFSGTLNLLRVINRGEAYAIFNAEQLAFAESIKQNTPSDALILHAPVHDDPVFLTGRRSFMGYPGHIWTHGIDYLPRDTEIRHIYEGSPEAQELIARYHIQYAVVSPQERNVMKVDDVFFERFGKVAELGEYRLYRTR